VNPDDYQGRPLLHPISLRLSPIPPARCRLWSEGLGTIALVVLYFWNLVLSGNAQVV
jgi:hypothetical protein